MKLNLNSTADTFWEDENGVEIDIRIHFHYRPAEPQTLEFPGEPECVDITFIYKKDNVGLDDVDWVDFYDDSDRECEEWATEILEMITTGDRDNEQ